MAVGRHRTERVEHCGPVVWQSTQKPIGGGPNASFDSMQYGGQQGSTADHQREFGIEASSIHGLTQYGDEFSTDEREATYVNHYCQRNQGQAPSPVAEPRADVD